MNKKRSSNKKYIGVISSLVVVIVLLLAINLSQRSTTPGLEKPISISLSKELSNKVEAKGVTEDAVNTISEIKSLLTDIDQTLSATIV